MSFDVERKGGISLGVAILAAGASLRMGQPKMLLPWKGTTVLGHLIAVWQEFRVEQIVVVCTKQNKAVTDELDRLRIPPSQRIFNPEPSRGMFSSIQCAAQWNDWNSAITHWAIVLGDQPQIQSDTLKRLLEHVNEHPNRICQPSWQGHPRHPVVLPIACWEELKTSNVATLKEYLQSVSPAPALLEVNDPGLDMDLDTPADYEQIRASEYDTGVK